MRLKRQGRRVATIAAHLHLPETLVLELLAEHLAARPPPLTLRKR